MPTLEAVTAISRLTVFPLHGLMVAYTTQHSDSRGIGDVAVVGILEPENTPGDRLWQLAASMFTNTPSGEAQAKWILTQCLRARMCRAPSYRDLPDAKWTAELSRTFVLSGMFANHDLLRTGQLVIQ